MAGQTDGQNLTVAFLNVCNGPQMYHYLLLTFRSQYTTNLLSVMYFKCEICAYSTRNQIAISPKHF